MKKLRTFFSLVALLGSVSAALAQEKTPVRMAHPPLALHELPLLVASERGLFDAEGLKVSHVFMTGGNEAAAALIAGNIDVLNASFTHPVNLRSKNIPVRFLSAIMSVRDWGVIVYQRHAALKGLQDLKGMKISVPRRGSDGDGVLRYALKSAGLDPETDVQLIQIGAFQNHLVALEKGDIDAAMVGEPFLTIGVRDGKGKALFDMLKGDGSDIMRQRVFTSMVVTESFLKDRSDIAQRMVRATTKATALLYSDPNAGFEVAQKYFPNIDKGVLREICGRLIAARAFLTRIDRKAVDAENDFLIKEGVIKAPVRYEDVVATEMSKFW